MDHEKTKMKSEPENDLEMHLDALEIIQQLVKFDKLEMEKKMKPEEKVTRLIKTEEGMVCGINQTITSLNIKLRELKNQILDKDRVVGAYQIRLQEFETKVTKLDQEIVELKKHKWMDAQIVKNFETTVEIMEQEIMVLKQQKRVDTKVTEDFETKVKKMEQQKWMDTGIMEELRTKLTEAELREEKLKKNSSEVSKTVEELRRRMIACEEEKKNSNRILAEMRCKESENIRFVERLRRKILEVESANEVMARELLKANSIVKELNERNLVAYKASEVHKKRFLNLVPIAEDLTSLLKMNVEDLENLRNKFAANECVSSPTVEDFPEKGPHASKALDFRIYACNQSTKTPNSHETTPSSAPTLDIIEMIDCETGMIHGKHVNSPSPHKKNKRNEIDCSEISAMIPKRKRSKRGVGVNNLLGNRKWMFGSDMLRAFEEDDELCLHAVCVLFRQHVLASKSNEASNRVLYHFEALSGCELAEYLVDGDPELRLMKSIPEVKQGFPTVVNQCRRLAIDYSSYFIAMRRVPCWDQDEPPSLSLSFSKNGEGESIPLGMTYRYTQLLVVGSSIL